MAHAAAKNLPHTRACLDKVPGTDVVVFNSLWVLEPLELFLEVQVCQIL